MSTRLPSRAVAVLLVAVASASCRAQAPETGVFITMIGADTVLVERFERTRDSVRGEIAVRAPGQAAQESQHLIYAAALAPQGLVSGVDLSVRIAGLVAQTAEVRLGLDSAGAHALFIQGADTTRTATVQGAVPLINVSLALLEQVVRRARNIPGDSVTVPLLSLEGGETTQSTVTFDTHDGAELVTASERMRLRVDAAGRILGGGDAARQIRVERVPVLPAGWLP
ncbi:MAG: hypothetical protein H0X64_05170 [Gemmatimonadaceae bacterium]|nr:hypothetical protein [Gemmatimonadaceae bacterium]